jgi:hypothetical protein
MKASDFQIGERVLCNFGTHRGQIAQVANETKDHTVIIRFSDGFWIEADPEAGEISKATLAQAQNN